MKTSAHALAESDDMDEIWCVTIHRYLLSRLLINIGFFRHALGTRVSCNREYMWRIESIVYKFTDITLSSLPRGQGVEQNAAA